ncbi:E3 ubiquitin-protein ligase arkadia-A isoform X3 [Drosophila montana]
MQSKRPAPAEFSSDSLSIYSRKQLRRSLTEQPGESIDNADSGGGGMENPLNAEEFFLPPIPHISMVEPPRYDMGSLKREAESHQAAASGSAAGAATAAGSLRNPFAPAFNLDYNNFYKASNSSSGAASSSSNLSGLGQINGGGSGSGSSCGGSLGINVGPATEYPNDLYMPSDYSKNFANHMDIPSNGSNMVMLSTTSLLHGNCVFNRNNTVATQQGMKTYWLCKSYRISMCRARCITHLGRIISATGVHNHMPHMRGNGGGGAGSGNAGNSVTVTPNPNPGQASYNVSEGSHVTSAPAAAVVEMNHGSGARLGANIFANQTPASPANHHHHHHHLTQALPNLLVQHHNSSHVSMEQHGMDNGPPPTQPPPPPPPPPSNSVIQNIMHNPNLMHLPHPHHHQQQQQQQHSPHHLELGVAGPGSSLLPLSPAQMQQQQSPQSNRSSHSMHATESPLGMKSPPPPPPPQSAEQQRHGDINASADGSAESAAGTAHVIDSITISPGSGSHNFKIENI